VLAALSPIANAEADPSPTAARHSARRGKAASHGCHAKRGATCRIKGHASHRGTVKLANRAAAKGGQD
jgi:hypothetical protein